MSETKEALELRDGDIFRWRWKDAERDADNAPYRSYHCKSQLAVVHNGRLYDTFWHDYLGNSDCVVKREDVILVLLGNSNDMTKIDRWKTVYYRPEDIVDMRHSNISGAPVYLKAGAKRDPKTMLAMVKWQTEECRRNIKSAERKLEDLALAETMIADGRIDEVYLSPTP